MEVLQNDIFGNKHTTAEDACKTKKPSATSQQKSFPNVTLLDGLDEQKIARDAMFIHRILQRKLIYTGLSNKKQVKTFIKVLNNELSIKSGMTDQITATRDSLIAFFMQQYT